MANPNSLRLVAVLAAVAACQSAARGPGAVSGGDAFRRRSLAHYAVYSDGGADWRIVDGALVGRGPAIQSVLIRRGVSLRDGWVEAESDRADDGGLVIRFQGPDDYHLLTFRDDAAPAPRGEQNLALYHHVGGQYRQIWERDVIWPRGARRTVRLQAEGAWFTVFLDGEPIDRVQPSARLNDPKPFTGPGGVGLRHYGADPSWRTRFTRFRWRATDPDR